MDSPTEFLRDAAAKAPEERVRISVRDFIAKWGAKRRGYWIVDKIERDLEKFGLMTQPSFTDGWIDNKISIVPVVDKTEQNFQSQVATPDTGELSELEQLDITLCIGSLESANLGVMSVKPEDTLEKAQSLMLRHDYSQLAVMSGSRDLRGAISWESIAQAKIRNPDSTLRDAVTTVDVVRTDDDLLSKIPRIVDAGFVFVQARDNTISGIVTTADLSEQFANLAAPFFLLAEIERRIRRIIDRGFTVSELQDVANPSNHDRVVESVDDLTFGEYCRLVESPTNWSRLGWNLDRKEFVAALHEIRQIRNDVMHFSPDPLGEEEVQKLKYFLKWLRRLDAD